MLSNYNLKTTRLKPDPTHQIMVTLDGEDFEKYLEVWENDVIVAANDEEVSPAIYLPYVAQCRNCQFTIHGRDLGVSVSVDDRGDSEDWVGPYTLANNGDQLVLKSTGIKWIIVQDNTGRQ